MASILPNRAVVGAVLLLLVSAPAHAVPLMHLSVGGAGPDGNVRTGDSVTLSILASGIPAGSDGFGLFGFGFDIGFDATGLAASNLTLGPLWQLTGFDDSLDLPGLVGLTSNRFFQTSGPFGDDILLGTIDFQGLVRGSYDLTLGFFTGVGDNVLFDGTMIDADPGFFGTGSITVPEPVSSVLFLIGLLALSSSRRR